MSTGEIIGGILLAPFIVYGLVRVGAAAYYKSKQQFNSPTKGR